MKIKPVTFLLAITFLFLFSGSVYGDDLQNGRDAYDRKDYATAYKLLAPLAEQGVANAQNVLGAMYGTGQGVDQDYKEAFKWFRLAAEQGFAKAQTNLGQMYSNGQGVDQDYKEAFKWFRLAAEQGFAKAQTNLGQMYAHGIGVPKDYVLAHMWFNLAGSNGYEKAMEYRDLLEKEMHFTEILKAGNLFEKKKEEEIIPSFCSKKFPKEKNMITVKGFYIGMNICDAEKLIREGKYKSVFAKNGISFLKRKWLIWKGNSYIIRDNEGKVTEFYFKKNLLHDLFKSKDMSIDMFAKNFGKHYIKGKFMYVMEPHNDVKNNNYGYKYYNGEVGYKFFIKQNESGTGVESLRIEKVAKTSEGFGD